MPTLFLAILTHFYISPQPWNKQIPLVPSTASTSAFTPFSGANITVPSLGKYDYQTDHFHCTAVIWIRRMHLSAAIPWGGGGGGNPGDIRSHGEGFVNFVR